MWPQDPGASQALNSPQNLQFALENFESVLNGSVRRAADTEHPQLAEMLMNYAAALWARYGTTGRPDADLRQAIVFI